MALLGCPKSPYRLDRLLNSLSKSLDETYERVLQNVDTDYKDDANRIFTTLCCVTRPLEASEVVDALAIELVHNPRLDVTRRFEDGADELQRLCPGFTEVYFDVQYGSPSTPIIQLAHFSVQEYLESEGIVRPEIALFAVKMQKTHALVTSVYFTLFLDPNMPAWEPDTDREDIRRQAISVSTLVPYAGAYWPRHFRASQEYQNVGRQVMQLLQATNRAFKAPIMLTQLYNKQISTSQYSDFDRLKGTPLHYA